MNLRFGSSKSCLTPQSLDTCFGESLLGSAVLGHFVVPGAGNESRHTVQATVLQNGLIASQLSRVTPSVCGYVKFARPKVYIGALAVRR
jgi:hypothetical protein